jgi:hypothetical protein
VSHPLYRLPWRIGTSPTLSVQITEGCGFGCCSGRCEPTPLATIKSELESIHHWPRTDSIALVGGEPSRHPNLADIVKFAARGRTKVVLCTNGYDLGLERLVELRDLGLWGVNLRVNREQQRPGWLDRSDSQIEGLRSHLAEMVSRASGLTCAFEVEVLEGHFRELADVLAWSERNIDRIQRVVVGLVPSETRDAPGVRPADMAESWAASGWMASDDPTVSAASVTWRVGRRGSEVLAASSRLLQMLCEGYESLHHRHFAFANPQSFRTQLSCWLGALTDMSLRPLAKEILASLRHPTKIISPRLASQFLFAMEPRPKSSDAPACPGAGWDSLAAPVGSILLSA